MARRMMQFQRPGARPTLDEIKAEYDLSDDEVDPDFGVVLIDPRDGTYAIRVEEHAAGRLTPGGTRGAGGTGRSSPSAPEAASERPGDTMRGPYSDPRIEPTGPPRPKRRGPEADEA